jgi:hypothetical protein
LPALPLTPVSPMAGDWTDARNEAIVADHFAMLADDIAGRMALGLTSFAR